MLPGTKVVTVTRDLLPLLITVSEAKRRFYLNFSVRKRDDSGKRSDARHAPLPQVPSTTGTRSRVTCDLKEAPRILGYSKRRKSSMKRERERERRYVEWIRQRYVSRLVSPRVPPRTPISFSNNLDAPESTIRPEPFSVVLYGRSYVYVELLYPVPSNFSTTNASSSTAITLPLLSGWKF